ncbi:CRTAC1 family protein [Tamlana sp. s12]|uniref:CRTAC1 family protein n=1 Tax=Tamlana sp. s12 TaxID=1630406 RepID=UPI00192B73AB|nr:CRTAC1 family protein [Tamlana sp. s12]QQY83302.1 CRTAC1 family protein [Tamlana sp. s12]
MACFLDILEPDMPLTFLENPEVIPLENRSRRKFDNAVVADLDQDGFLDLLLTEHSRRVEVFWNNKGVFSQGKPFVFGDTHGIAVGDYDKDGLIDVFVQPGGGDGKNPRKLKGYSISKDRSVSKEKEFTHFEASRGRAVKLVDANNNGNLDLVLTAFPKNNTSDRAHFLYKKDEAHGFSFLELLPTADRFNMRTLITDFNKDNIKDFLFYGGAKVIAVQGEKDYGYKEVTKDVLGNLAHTNLVSSMAEIDFDNDGDFDLILTRAKHPFDSETDYDKTQKTFYFLNRRKTFLHDSLKIKGGFKLENLQMAYPHFDVFFGKDKTLFQRESDVHGGHNLSVTAKEAQGWPEDTSQKGLYIGYLGNGYWRIAGFTSAPTTGVIHNVMEQPELVKMQDLPAKLLENRNGKFVDVSEKYGVDVTEQTAGVTVADFDNDGWQDIFMVRYGHSASQIEQFLFLNQKGKGFSLAQNHGIIRKELGSTGICAEVFDYDKDGDVDIIYANERGKWHLFTNNLNRANNYITVHVGDSPIHKVSPIGAVLTIESEGLIYRRVVGATSSSYSQSYNTYLHVGLGTKRKIDKAFVTWNNGESLELNIKEFNKTYEAN